VDDVKELFEEVSNGSLITTLGNDEGITFTTFRVIDQPGQQIYSNPTYKEVIPRVLGNWKTTMLRALFLAPTNPVMEAIQKLHDKMKQVPHTQFISVQLRHYAFHGYSETRPERMWGCLQYFQNRNIVGVPLINHSITYNNNSFNNDNSNVSTIFYLSSDTKEKRDEMSKLFPGRVFSLEDVDENMLPVHVTEHWDNTNYDRDLIGVMIDWWMIGEGDLKVITGKSSFGGTASDRTFTSRFIISYTNQCIDEKKEYYLDNIYYPLMNSYNQTQTMVHVNEQKKKKKK